MEYLRLSGDRGKTDLKWLKSHHTFSFSGYRDRDHMGFSALRVINDDYVDPGEGFSTHPHEDMEIISYVLDGTIEHKDSMGNVEVLPAGEFQLMSAGTGVLHSEYNPSKTESLTFFQIWIKPSQKGVAPGYQQKQFGTETGLTQIVSPDGRNGTLRIHQDAFLYRLLMESGQSVGHQLEADRAVYVHVISGSVQVNDHILKAGDGIGLSEVGSVEFHARGSVEALVFDLP